MKENKINDPFELVKTGYNEIATIHETWTDKSLPDLEIFKKFFSLISNQKNILDLGCGSGSKIAWYFFEQGYTYTGVDVSESQLILARKNYPSFSDNFHLGEMVQFCKRQEENAFDGIIALFSIFHLPLNYQLELFNEIKRILRKNALLLFTTSISDDEGVEENWLGGSKPMYWSNKPFTWYESKLSELGFKKIDRYKRIHVFDNQEETTYFLLFQK